MPNTKQPKILELFQYKDGFRYTSDTVFLYNFISQFNIKGKVLDIGAGCGILGLLLARDFKIELSGVEVLPKMYELCLKNSETNSIQANFINENIFDCDLNEFDFIVSNPPFYSNHVLKSDCPTLKSARYSDSMPLDQFVAICKKKLKANGELFFCFDAKRVDEIFLEFAKQSGFRIIAIQFIHPKKGKNSKLVMLRAKKNSKSSLEIMSPLFVNTRSEYSPEIIDIFSKTNMLSIDIEQ